jgi:hypothetical protein
MSHYSNPPSGQSEASLPCDFFDLVQINCQTSAPFDMLPMRFKLWRLPHSGHLRFGG